MEKVQDAKRRADNAKKAKEAADHLFPGEKWKNVEDGIYLSPHRPIGKNSNYKDELRGILAVCYEFSPSDSRAQILRDFGSTIYLVPESSRQAGKKYDAIVNGMKFEFKNIKGNANTLEIQFLRSRSQAPNAFINLEKSNLTRQEIMSTLYGARNKPETEISRGYDYYNRFEGGRIILKIKSEKSLIFLNADDLKKL
jgi:hypothetical protein